MKGANFKQNQGLGQGQTRSLIPKHRGFSVTHMDSVGRGQRSNRPGQRVNKQFQFGGNLDLINRGRDFERVDAYIYI